ncbi:MAG: CocE/NonD family hydrolase [Chloroflexi bacterium]|nr:CocE/NonD family hydrolase [Chloroflexota bacterium]
MPDTISQSRSTVQFDLPVPMRDGAALPADVYLPDGPGPHPTLLSRTPYDKSGLTGPRFTSIDALTATQRGFAVVVQDVRGRHNADGRFITFKHESSDGYDAIEWIASQSWCNGKIGTYGASYLGATQWLAAKASPPHLAAMVPRVTASDYHEGWTYQGGAFSLGFNVSWSLAALTARNHRQLTRSLDLQSERFAIMRDAVDATEKAFAHLPLTDNPWLPKDLAPYYYEWLEHPALDDYWQQYRIENSYSDITAPALNIGGWYDIFLLGTIRNFLGLRNGGGSEAARSGSRLLIGPWSHTTLGQNQTGANDYGTIASQLGLDLDELTFNWFDRWLKDADTGNARIDDGGSPITIFVMGDNAWRDESEWPLARATRTRFYLHSDGHANSRNGDGVLSTEPPAGEPSDQFRYDPMDPVPTKGGPLCCSPTFMPSGPQDHSANEDRADVLVYSTPPLEQDVEVTGPVRLVLRAASSAVDTDFTAMLLDARPCGCAHNLCDGILRARYRNDPAAPMFLTPGEPALFEIDLVATSNVFKKGHSIRLEVSSSNFPRFNRNLNTGKEFESDEVAVATNTVFHTSEMPSYMELDIVPR